MKIYTLRYLFLLKDSEQVNYKIVSDCLSGHKSLFESMKSDENLVKCTYEYLNEYDCDKLFEVAPLVIDGVASEKPFGLLEEVSEDA